ncbi:TadE/TadG family type IV pilus assembly protein [Bradyrhizobium sp. CCBAU 11386]|uniref:TadE/TadG family type IV pilus assembly protein n=1 Tax=Bradyrhizobium sp. CCBAU 11386 TaxID=1630837 RepID=UPI0023027040|nr:TadE/TadG family type IV pilus assembly protein [Bradyrhizobium sp. CCBAU 11386]
MIYRRFLRDRRGTAAIEFILIAMVLFTLLLAVAGFGNVAQRQIAIQTAVRAGGEYARFFPTDTSGIQTAVTNALPSGWSLSGTPAVTCSCNGAATSCSAIATGTKCDFPFLVNISASMSAISVVTPLWSQSFNNSASYEVRIQ